MEFSRQEYWNRLPFPPPGNLPDPGIDPVSPVLAGGFFTGKNSLPGKPCAILSKLVVYPLSIWEQDPTCHNEESALRPGAATLKKKNNGDLIFVQWLFINIAGVFACLHLFFFFFNISFYLFIWPLWVLVGACGNEFPGQGLNSGLLHWEHGVLATGQSGKSPVI